MSRIIKKKGSLSPRSLGTSSFPKSSIFRILNSVVKSGYVIYDTDTKKYRGSLKLSKLGALVIQQINLRTFVHPFLLKLNEATNYTCHLGILNGQVGVYLDKIETSHFGIKLFSEIGKTFPLHCNSMGKVLLAYMESEKLSKILSGKLISMTPKTITKVKILERQLKEIRKTGYAIDREETTRGIICVGSPIRNKAGDVLAAISVTFPTFIERDEGLNLAISSVKECAASISKVLSEDPNISMKITEELADLVERI